MLVVDDDPGASGLLRDIFGREGFDVTVVARGGDALRAAGARPFEIVLSDVKLPDLDGLEVLRRLRAEHPDLTVILITAFGTVEMAVRALHEGAFDYVRKPFQVGEVVGCVSRAMERRRVLREAGGGPPAAPTTARPPMPTIIGASPGMVELFKLVHRVAGARSSVLIVGESGTGKELIARTIHHHGPRRDNPYVAVNCTSLSETLLESELFGHVKGAFTGAIERRPGLFLEANHGTVFLDEVGDMSLSMQAKLLRVLQEQEVKPVGGTETVPVDTRVVAATHRDLSSLTRTGRFREDLYYRLNVVRLDVPPLRARVDDIPLLAAHFLRHYSTLSGRPVHGFSREAMAALVAYDWPGNVRELENVVDRAVTLATGAVVGETDLPGSLLGALRAPAGGPKGRAGSGLAGSPDRPPLEEVIRRYVFGVLAEVAGNKSEAARILGVPRRSLYRLLGRLSAPTAGTPRARRYDTHMSQ
ncbi:MAG TPA: sigma-54 dependent transcriptional regulator [Candidatus Eisenbacteria bacterium]|jgi:DNA-binding NtrC family response regulator